MNILSTLWYFNDKSTIWHAFNKILIIQGLQRLWTHQPRRLNFFYMSSRVKWANRLEVLRRGGGSSKDKKFSVRHFRNFSDYKRACMKQHIKVCCAFDSYAAVAVHSKTSAHAPNSIINFVRGERKINRFKKMLFRWSEMSTALFRLTAGYIFSIL